MGAASRLLPALRQTLEGVFPDHLEHPEAGLLPVAFTPGQQALVDERADAFEHVEAQILAGVAYRFRGFERAAAHEDSQAAKEACSGAGSSS